MSKLKQIPIPVAIVIMVVLMLAGVAFGNNNALSDARKAPEAQLTEVSALAAQRVGSAKNLLVVAGRNNVEQKDIKALEDAIAALEDARKADKIASANRSLTFAADVVIQQVKQSASEQDRKLTTGVEDDLTAYNQRLIRSAGIYNESLEAVQSLYKKLPMRWIIGDVPEVFQ